MAGYRHEVVMTIYACAALLQEMMDDRTYSAKADTSRAAPWVLSEVMREHRDMLFLSGVLSSEVLDYGWMALSVEWTGEHRDMLLKLRREISRFLRDVDPGGG